MTIPSRRVSANRRRNAVTSTGRRSGSCTSGRAKISSWNSRSAWASSTSPTPVECSGSRPPTRYSTVIADRPESRSTRTASVPSWTASRTCCPVAIDRSPITGIAASRNPWLRGAKDANSHSRSPITYERPRRSNAPCATNCRASRNAVLTGMPERRARSLSDRIRCAGSNPDSKPNARSITGSPVTVVADSVACLPAMFTLPRQVTSDPRRKSYHSVASAVLPVGARSALLPHRTPRKAGAPSDPEQSLSSGIAHQ